MQLVRNQMIANMGEDIDYEQLKADMISLLKDVLPSDLLDDERYEFSLPGKDTLEDPYKIGETQYITYYKRAKSEETQDDDDEGKP